MGSNRLAAGAVMVGTVVLKSCGLSCVQFACSPFDFMILNVSSHNPKTSILGWLECDPEMLSFFYQLQIFQGVVCFFHYDSLQAPDTPNWQAFKKTHRCYDYEALVNKVMIQLF